MLFSGDLVFSRFYFCDYSDIATYFEITQEYDYTDYICYAIISHIGGYYDDQTYIALNSSNGKIQIIVIGVNQKCLIQRCNETKEI